MMGVAATAGGALHGHSGKLTLFGDLKGFKSVYLGFRNQFY
jgi:hypothetical protein